MRTNPLWLIFKSITHHNNNRKAWQRGGGWGGCLLDLSVMEVIPVSAIWRFTWSIFVSHNLSASGSIWVCVNTFIWRLRSQELHGCSRSEDRYLSCGFWTHSIQRKPSFTCVLQALPQQNNNTVNKARVCWTSAITTIQCNNILKRIQVCCRIARYDHGGTMKYVVSIFTSEVASQKCKVIEIARPVPVMRISKQLVPNNTFFKYSEALPQHNITKHGVVCWTLAITRYLYQLAENYTGQYAVASPMPNQDCMKYVYDF